MEHVRDDGHCEACWNDILTAQNRAEFQGQALRWLAVLAPIVLGIASLVLVVSK